MVASLALFVALTGVSYAAVGISKNSVGREQIRDGAITKKKINAHTWAAMQGHAGAQGAMGPVGPQGTTGESGADGADGTDGSVGATGVAGSTGAQGATGSSGSDGAQGPTGPRGPSDVYVTHVPGPINASNLNSITRVAELELPTGDYFVTFTVTASYNESLQFSNVNCFFDMDIAFDGSQATLQPNYPFPTFATLSKTSTASVFYDPEGIPPNVTCVADGGEGPTISYSDISFTATPVTTVHDQSPTS